MVSVVLFLGGLFFQWIWISTWLLPLLYGLPRAAYYTWCGTLHAGSMLAYVRTVILASVLLVGVALLITALGFRELILSSRAIAFGQLIGIVSWVSAYILARDGRASLNTDFWRAMTAYDRSRV